MFIWHPVIIIGWAINQIFMSGIVEGFLDMHDTYTFNKTSLLYMCCL